MAEVIPIASNPAPVRSLPIPQTGSVRRAGGHWSDTRGRPLRDLRISVTDHCNFRCRYCMPKEKFSNPHAFLAHTELLTFEEILRIARIVVANGVEKLRLTGGEPLLRKGLEELVADLRRLKTPDGREIDIALTTNASILHKKARALREAGLDRVTISLDALDEGIFQGFNDVGFPAAKVLENIRHAAELGFRIKVNTVVKRGVNESEIVRICEYFRNTGIIPRFIEYMDVGTSNGWRMTDVVPSAEVVDMIRAKWPSNPSAPIIQAKRPRAGAIRTAPANSDAFLLSPKPSAANAPARGSAWTGGFTSASLQPRGMTSARCFAAVPQTSRSSRRSAASGQLGTITTPNFARSVLRPSAPRSK